MAVLCSLTLVIAGLAISAPQNVQAADSESKMVTLEGFETVTIKDFAKNGVQMPEGRYGTSEAS